MIVIVWEFRLQPGREADFERTYGPDGDWARLFRRCPAYHGTELLRDSERYLTLDRWDDVSDFEAFKAQHGDDYKALDEACEPLCAEEKLVGRFAVMGESG